MTLLPKNKLIISEVTRYLNSSMATFKLVDAKTQVNKQK